MIVKLNIRLFFLNLWKLSLWTYKMQQLYKNHKYSVHTFATRAVPPNRIPQIYLLSLLVRQKYKYKSSCCVALRWRSQFQGHHSHRMGLLFFGNKIFSWVALEQPLVELCQCCTKDDVRLSLSLLHRGTWTGQPASENIFHHDAFWEFLRWLMAAC